MRLARASGLTSGLPPGPFSGRGNWGIEIWATFGWPSLAILMVAPGRSARRPAERGAAGL